MKVTIQLKKSMRSIGLHEQLPLITYSLLTDSFPVAAEEDLAKENCIKGSPNYFLRPSQHTPQPKQ